MAKKKRVGPRPKKSKPTVKKARSGKRASAKKARPAKARPVKARPVKARPVKARPAEISTEAGPESLGLQSPIPVAWLVDEAGRELALDSLAAWVAATLQAAQGDAAAREILRVAIETFYDIREAAKQPRGEYAGHFFIVDAVGLGESNRPVPWQVLAETVSQERLDRFSAIFEDAVREIS